MCGLLPKSCGLRAFCMNESSIEQQLQKNGVYVSTTHGVSMYPMLRDRRDHVVIRPLPPGARLRVYDVPLFRRPNGQYVLHRVLRVCDGYYQICGDHQYQMERVPDDWILGRLESFWRGNRQIDCAKNRGYRLYVRLWCGLFPVRALWLRSWYFAKRTVKKLVGRG